MTESTAALRSPSTSTADPLISIRGVRKTFVTREKTVNALAERDRLTTALRERGLLVSDSQANFVWLPLGERTAAVAAGLESRAVITRPFAGEGLRVTVGTPEEDDVFLAALDGALATAAP